MQDDDRLVQTVDKDGKDIDLYILKPNYRINRLCDLEYHKAWTFAIDNGVKTHTYLEGLFAANDIWTDKDEQELREINAKIAVQTVFMQKFYDQKKFDKAAEAAAEVAKMRNRAHDLGRAKGDAYIHSAEGIAGEIRMEAYLAFATVYNEDHDKMFFKDYEDFKNRRDEQAAIDVQAVYIGMIAEENTNLINELPENRLLGEIGSLEKRSKLKKKKTSSKKRAAKKKTKKKKKKSGK